MASASRVSKLGPPLDLSESAWTSNGRCICFFPSGNECKKDYEKSYDILHSLPLEEKHMQRPLLAALVSGKLGEWLKLLCLQWEVEWDDLYCLFPGFGCCSLFDQS